MPQTEAYDPLESVIFKREAIAARVAEMGAQITGDMERSGVRELSVVAVAAAR